MSPSGRLSGSLPVSIGVHCVAIGVLLVAPLTTDLTVPGLITRAPSYVAAVAVPPPPPLVRAATTQTPLAAQAYHDGAPATAPPKINPEDSSAALPVPDVPVGDVSASSDLGAIVEGAGRFVAPPPHAPRIRTRSRQRARAPAAEDRRRAARVPRDRASGEGGRARSFSRRFSTAMAASIEHGSCDRFRCSTPQRWMRCGSGGTRQPY